MKYIKTHEEINWSKLNPLRGFKDHPFILDKKSEIEDLMQDLYDINLYEKQFSFIKGETLLYRFILKDDICLLDYKYEIKGRLGDIDPNINVYFETRELSYDRKRLDIIFSYEKLDIEYYSKYI